MMYSLLLLTAGLCSFTFGREDVQQSSLHVEFTINGHGNATISRSGDHSDHSDHSDPVNPSCEMVLPTPAADGCVENELDNARLTSNATLNFGRDYGNGTCAGSSAYVEKLNWLSKYPPPKKLLAISANIEPSCYDNQEHKLSCEQQEKRQSEVWARQEEIEKGFPCEDVPSSSEVSYAISFIEEATINGILNLEGGVATNLTLDEGAQVGLVLGDPLINQLRCQNRAAPSTKPKSGGKIKKLKSNMYGATSQA